MSQLGDSILSDVNDAPEQHGLAGFLSLKPNYAEYPFPEAFDDIQELLPHLGKLPPERIPLLDWTVFYSRRRDLTPEETKMLIEDDLGALVGAIDTGGLLAYGRGFLLKNKDRGVGPYDDFTFTPNCFSWCLWMSHEDAVQGSSTPQHREAIAHVKQWFSKDNFKIVKLRSSITRRDDGPELTFERVPLVGHGHAHAGAHAAHYGIA
jgi:hypothetical protein